MLSRHARSTISCAASLPTCAASAIDTASASVKPPVSCRLVAIFDASTSSACIVSIVWASAPAVSMQISGSVSHSACQPPKPRSCSCTIADSIVDTSAGTRCAAASTTAELMGLRLCGIVDEPPRPAAAGSNASPTSVCIISETSRAILPSVPTSNPSVVATSATRSRCVCQGTSGSTKSRSFASATETASPCSPSEASVPVAPPNCSTATRGRRASIRTRCLSMALKFPAALRPSVTGVACCSHVLPLCAVRACVCASVASAVDSVARSPETRSSAARSCSTSPVSIASWLVAPQCT